MERPDKVKSYSHGAVAALLEVTAKLQLPSIINKHVRARRSYVATKPTRNELTVGMTLVLGAMGRVCMPTSKRGWWNWAKTTSCEYMLRCALSQVDSQHFWDLMDALPVKAIARIEEEVLRRVKQAYSLDGDTLFFDTTNFFTFIATTNKRCTIAQRGKNKQKRGDLRQVGLAMAVTRKDYIPIFHLTYKGNCHDTKVFGAVLGKIKKRMRALGMDIERHTLVFDRGNNSKKNMALVADAKMHYAGALTPYHHRALLDKAAGQYEPVEVNGETLDVFRTKETIWGEERTVLVFLSHRLKAGQLRGIYKSLANKERQLEMLREKLEEPNKQTLDKKQLEARIEALAKGQHIDGVIEWDLGETAQGRFQLKFKLNHDTLAAIENRLGFRILMTDRHGWDTVDIIQAFHGQARIEQAFKNIKNPYHLALRPQFHWTDQKIQVHYHMCVLGYLLSALIWKEAREKASFTGSLDTLLDTLNNIRLAALIESKKGRGRPKVIYQIEEMSEEEGTLVHALGIAQSHRRRPEIDGIGVYTPKNT
jgi:transposase